jgi:hypothetical protein
MAWLDGVVITTRVRTHSALGDRSPGLLRQRICNSARALRGELLTTASAIPRRRFAPLATNATLDRVPRLLEIAKIRATRFRKRSF